MTTKKTKIACIPAFNVMKDIPGHHGWHMPNTMLPVYFTDGNKNLNLPGLYREVAPSADSELREVSLSTMAGHPVVSDMAKELKQGNHYITGDLMRRYMQSQVLTHMAGCVMGKASAQKHVTDFVAKEDTKFCQIVCVLEYRPGFWIVKGTRAFSVSENKRILDRPMMDWMHHMLDSNGLYDKRNCVFYVTESSADTFHHGTIEFAVTRSLSIPTTNGAQSGLEYVLDCKMNEDVTVTKINIG